MAVIFHNLATVENAKKLTEDHTKMVTESESVIVAGALGRVLSNDVYSPIDSPPFDRSEVDGYAVISSSVENAEQDHPVKLTIVGNSNIGEAPKVLKEESGCFRIATGSIVPFNSDAVVMAEYTKESKDTVEILRAVKPGENVTLSGTDVSLGELLLRRDTFLGPREIAVLSSTGVEKVNVYRKMKIGIISTGNELVEPGRELSDGQIYESNGITIKNMLDQYGVFDPEYLGIIRDEMNVIRSTISSMIKDYDVVITSGSTSAGEGDMVYRVLGDLDPGILFHGVEIKPGKPTLLAASGSKPVYGLPGFPVSAVMVFETIFLPSLLKSAHVKRSIKHVMAKVPVRVSLSVGKLNLIPVSLVRRGVNVAYPLLGDSGSVSRLTRSDGYISVYGDRSFIDENEELNVTLFSEDVEVPDVNFIGSHDIALDSIFHRIDLNVKIINVGSMGGVQAIKRGEADIAGVHILNPLTMEYNDFKGDPVLEEKSVLVKGYRREQGILVKKGNPMNIRNISDIAERGARFVNRNSGSGTRILIEKMLKDSGIDSRSIKNFRYEVKTHNAVANAIRSGRGDAGIAIRQVASMYGLDFIPIGFEEYDFLVLRESLDKLSSFINTLKSQWFTDLLSKEFSGYEPY
ncbi:MAG: molybdopterin biosynthesis protein [Thermoplasmataceae archaeon]|jgi:putative molybdopterin biosynthesis protein